MREKIKIWERKFQIPISSVNFRGELRLDSIFNFMQNEALMHSERIGVGFKKFLNDGQIWVLTWAKIKIIKYPKFEEFITIKTWLKEQKKLFTMRDFIFLNSEEKEIVKASTGWLLLNAETKRPTKPKDLPDTVEFIPEEKALDEEPKKLEAIENPVKLKEKKIGYTDIDMNNHTNNSKYIEFILDSFPLERFKKSSINELTLFFFSESRFGDIIEIYHKQKNNITNVLIRNKSKETQLLRADIIWNNLK